MLLQLQLEFSKFQDRMTYMDTNELKDDTSAKRIRLDLKNSETRMKATKTVNRAYEKIINTMMYVSKRKEPIV